MVLTKPSVVYAFNRTVPTLLMLIFSIPLVENPRLLNAGLKIPVFGFALKLNIGVPPFPKLFAKNCPVVVILNFSTAFVLTTKSWPSIVPI